MVFQQPTLFPWKTVLENVAFGPLMTGRSRSGAEGEARTLLEMVGLSKFAARYPGTLSGGMQQRVGIARALANYPSVLLMDEPFGALDSQTRSMMQENLLQLWSEFRITVLFVTHDIEEAIFIGDRVVVMSASPGRIIADMPIDLPRPRVQEMLFDAYFARLKRQCMELIRVESLKAFEQQNESA
jgi:NitT/TauT family transport system ATP-binding protein